jgi:hypothetical protein
MAAVVATSPSSCLAIGPADHLAGLRNTRHFTGASKIGVAAARDAMTSTRRSAPALLTTEPSPTPARHATADGCRRPDARLANGERTRVIAKDFAVHHATMARLRRPARTALTTRSAVGENSVFVGTSTNGNTTPNFQVSRRLKSSFKSVADHREKKTRRALAYRGQVGRGEKGRQPCWAPAPSWGNSCRWRIAAGPVASDRCGIRPRG